MENIEKALCCAVANDEHFLERPITLSCGHSVCKSCVPISITDIVCKVCNEKNEFDLKKAKESFGMKTLLACNFEAIYKIVHKRFIGSIEHLKGNFYILSGIIIRYI
jgi:hypothetical protein